MNYELLLSFVFFILFSSCSSFLNENTDVVNDEEVRVEKLIEPSQIIPIRIANDSATIKITHQDVFGENLFSIVLLEADSISLHLDYSKYSITDSIKLDEIFDLLNVTALADLYIEQISYENIRANSLYFNSIMKNKHNEEVIDVRFSLLYRNTSRFEKGDLYGWLLSKNKID